MATMDYRTRDRLKRKLVSQTLLWLLAAGGLLFGSAGTLDWPGAWVFLLIWLIGAIAAGLALARTNPDILEVRLHSPAIATAKTWDRRLLLAIFAAWVAEHMVAGLDRRFGWSNVPNGFEIIGAFSVALAIYVSYVVLRENSFAAPIVKIDRSRGHKVVDAGPYAFVRHPMYSSALLYFAGAALLLGSWWALLVAVLLVSILAIRAVREEKLLAAELSGYAAYMQRVRYRFLPGIW